MYYKLTASLSTLFLFLFACGVTEETTETYVYNPRTYVIQATTDTILVDGLANDKDWVQAQWSDNYVDIEGFHRETPRFSTRMKLLWDSAGLYIFAELIEPHIWGTLTKRESVIFHDNDFEVFIDPDADTHNYYEYEINALGTEWDLKLSKPYKNGGEYDNGWNVEGVKKAIHIDGTLNDPADIDHKWNIELFFPWKSITEHKGPEYIPEDGEIWKMNFSRVEWQVDTTASPYKKLTYVAEDGKEKPLHEKNWVWSPQGIINMHLPERWGLVQFSAKPAGTKSPFVSDGKDDAFWKMRMVYDSIFSKDKTSAEAYLDYVRQTDLFYKDMKCQWEGSTFTLIKPWGNQTIYLEKDSRIYLKTP